MKIGEEEVMEEAEVNVPVLLLVFNRPHLVKDVKNALRRVRPRILYIAADGPRAGHPSDRVLCEKARVEALGIDWPCQTKTLFREHNLGCRRAVSEAIDWFFEQEECGIILEDDCVPHPSFFRYVSELLGRYREDERVMVVSAQHFHGVAHQPPYSYFFSRYNHCWGWGSWRRAWRLYDAEMKAWPLLRDTDWLLGVGDGSEQFKRYWTEIFDTAYADAVDSWAYRWTFSCWANSGLTVLPSKNLVTNIGFGHDGTHTRTADGVADALPLEELAFPLRHPPFVVRDTAADRWSDRYIFRISPLESIWRRLREFSFIKASRSILRVLGKTARYPFG